MQRILKIRTSRDYYDIRESAENSIDVGELINILSGYPSSTKIVLSFDNGYIYGSMNYDMFKDVSVESFDEEAERIKKEEEEENEYLRIYDNLWDNELDGLEEVYINRDGFVVLDIDGDWKHSHLRADHLMQMIGYKCVREEEMDDTGSDWGRSLHYYTKV